MKRRCGIALFVIGLLAVAATTSISTSVLAADNSAVKVSLNTGSASPREVEDATVQAITRDYSKAWQTLGQALADNRADVLSQSFTGPAKERLSQVIGEQQKEGLSRRYIDRGHKVDVIFYSVEGSAMQLRDTTQIEIQWLDGGKVVHSEQATLHYLALMTPAENSWKVRVLESVPSF